MHVFENRGRTFKLAMAILGLSLAAQAGLMQTARPIWPEGQTKAMNTFFRFETRFAVRAGERPVLKVTAGYDYRARLNGKFVGFGPARCVPGCFRVDEWPLAVQDGENVLEIESAGYNCGNYYLCVQEPFVQAEVVLGDRVLAATGKDGAFRAYRTGRVQKVPRFCYQRTFCEVYRLPCCPGDPLVLAEQPQKCLMKREWAYPDFHLTDPFVAVSREKVERDEKTKLFTPRFIVPPAPHVQCYRLDELEENPYYDLQKLKVVSRVPVGSQSDRYALAANEGLVFRGEAIFAGFPTLEVNCKEPVTIYLSFDEIVQEDGSVDHLRTDTVGAYTWHLEPGRHALEGFEPVGLKYMRVLAVGGAAEISAPRMRTYLSPLAARAKFKASDLALEKIFEAAKRSYTANAVDCLTDCPTRERAGWLGDTFFTGRASQWLTGSGRNERLFLNNYLMPEKFGDFEKLKGLVPAVYPVDLMTETCFIPNFTMWFVQELEEHCRRNGDRAFQEAFRKRVLECIACLDRYCNSDGLLEDLPGWIFLEWSQANKLIRDVNYPSNMMYAKTLDAVARMYGLPEFAERAAKIRATVRKQALLPGGWFCDNAVRQPDGKLKLSGERTETCQYYAFFTGTATKEGDCELWRRLVTDFGPNRAAEGKWKEIWPANFIFGTCLRMELLSLDGRAAQMYGELRDYFLYMAERTGTLWEHTKPSASCCHGFSSIASEYLFRDILGVRAIDRTAKTIRLEAPRGIALDWCEGTVPLSENEVAEIRWQKKDDDFTYDVTLPKGWTRKADKMPPVALAWQFDDRTLSRRKYLKDVDFIASNTLVNVLAPAPVTHVNAEDPDQFHDACKELVERARAKGIRTVLRLTPPCKGFFNASVDGADEGTYVMENQREAQGIAYESEVTADKDGFASVAVEARWNRNKIRPLRNEIVAVYAFEKTGDGFYRPGSLVDVTAKARPVSRTSRAQTVEIDAGPAFAGKTFYVLTAQYFNGSDLFGGARTRLETEVMDTLADVPLAGFVHDEFGWMMLNTSGISSGKVGPWRGRFYSKAQADWWRDERKVDLKRLLLDMRYAPQDDEAVRIRAINAYMEVISRKPAEVERELVAYEKSRWGEDLFLSCHSTFHNHLDGDEVWHTGCDWWETPRDFGFTDEWIDYPTRMGVLYAAKEPFLIHMFYSKKADDYYNQIVGLLPFNGREFHHSYNDDVWGKGFQANDMEFLANIRKFDAVAQKLNAFQAKSLPRMDLLVVFGKGALFNWYPDVAARNCWDIDGSLQIQKKADALWQAGYRCALVPDTLIEYGKLTVKDGAFVCNGHKFGHCLFLYPKYAKKCTYAFLNAAVAEGLPIAAVGRADIDFDAEQASFSGKAYEKFSVKIAEDLGTPKSAIPGGAVAADGSFVLASRGILDGKPVKFDFSIDGVRYTGEHTGYLAYRKGEQVVSSPGSHLQTAVTASSNVVK